MTRHNASFCGSDTTPPVHFNKILVERLRLRVDSDDGGLEPWHRDDLSVTRNVVLRSTRRSLLIKTEMSGHDGSSGYTRSSTASDAAR